MNNYILIAIGLIVLYFLFKPDLQYNPLQEEIQDENYVDYALDPYTTLEESEALYQKIHRIDRAYATRDEDIFVTEIARKNWPITPIKCYHFATNFFKSAKLLGAYKVDGVIDYTWQDAKRIV